MERALYVIDRYGIRRWLADIDSGRAYGRSGEGHCGDTIIDSDLNWSVNEGFADVMEHVGVTYWSDALEYRQRHLLQAMRAKGS